MRIDDEGEGRTGGADVERSGRPAAGASLRLADGPASASAAARAAAPARALAGALALSSLLLGGCALLPDGPWNGDAQPTEAARTTASQALVLDDLVAALEQLHPPRVTTLQVALAPEHEHERALIGRLAGSGYGIQRVDADQGPRHVSLTRQADVVADGVTFTTFELNVGPSSLTRSYAYEDGGVRPAGALIVGGTRRQIALEDARFGAGVDGAHSRVVHTGAAAAPEDMPLISLITDEVVRGVAREATRGSRSRSPSVAAVNSGRVEVANLFYGDGGAFGALRDSFDTAERLTVIFPNDSMRLGAAGKRQIERFVEGYREESDMIGLIGCSNGPTALAIGNEGLALGRSKRVAEELLALGVARERVIDEGCWAPVNASDRFPSRGVVVELLRGAS